MINLTILKICYSINILRNRHFPNRRKLKKPLLIPRKVKSFTSNSVTVISKLSGTHSYQYILKFTFVGLVPKSEHTANGVLEKSDLEGELVTKNQVDKNGGENTQGNTGKMLYSILPICQFILIRIT